MIRGKKPIPASVHVLYGNTAKKPARKLRKTKFDTTADLSHPLPGLMPSAVEWWKYFLSHAVSGQIKTVDGPLLVICCNAFATMLDAQRIVNDSSSILRNRNGDIQRNPALLTVSKAAELFIRSANELGFTPSARARLVSGATGDDGDELGALIGS